MFDNINVGLIVINSANKMRTAKIID